MIEEIKNKEYWDTLIIDRLSGNISDEDSRFLDAWLEESGKHRSYFGGMKDLWDSSGAADPRLPFDYEKAYSLFLKRIHAKEGDTSVLQPKKSKLFIRRIAAVAAVLLPIIVLSYYTFLYFHPELPDLEPLLSEVISPNGSKTQLRLADGTIVWLNSGTKLFYDNRFGKENRNLELTGEAYLDVAHNEQMPLVVKVGKLSVKVLGTQFNVNAYPETGEVKVSLLEGSVSMDNDLADAPVVLKPMETGIYRIDSHRITITKGLEKNALSWMKNQLVFNGETFEEIACLLERRFDVKIHIHKKELKKRRFGGDFGKDESIEKVLKIMAVNGKFKYTIKNDIVEIY